MFKKATRNQAKLRLGISGVTNSGKTWSSLLMATGMAETLKSRIALIDTERRAHLYGDDFDFDAVEIHAPFTVEKYVEAIKFAENAGYKVLIIDSLSHAWNGDGGVLDAVKNAGGQFQKGWDKGTPLQNKLIDTIMQSKMHIIVTVREKMEYVMEVTAKEGGKLITSPKKVGLAPVQRDALQYEFTVWMKMNLEHIAEFEKDNTRLFREQYITPTKEMGSKLVEWLESGEIIKEETIEDKISQVTQFDDLEELKAYFNEQPKSVRDNLNFKTACTIQRGLIENANKKAAEKPSYKEAIKSGEAALDDMADNGFPIDDEEKRLLEEDFKRTAAKQPLENAA